MTNEIRQNKVTREWVIYAPDRGKRPKDVEHDDRPRTGDLPVHDDDCPFCPGNEAMLPDIIMEQSGAMPPGHWQTRVVPNKFPVLVGAEDTHREQRGIYRVMPGYGQHEVIIEHPHHNQTIARMTQSEVETVIETYHRRYSDVMRAHSTMMAILFRNHGAQAGTSLLHPHSQLVVTGIVPHHIRWRETQAQRYFDDMGRCIFCDIAAFEARDRQRLVVENETFLAVVPFAAEVPYEAWIMPRRHQADFGSIHDSEKAGLAAALRDVLGRLYTHLDDPDYNYIINTAPRFKAEEPHVHWYLQIRPRLVTRAGFEIGSGISVNPSMPEANARALRDTVPPSHMD